MLVIVATPITQIFTRALRIGLHDLPPDVITLFISFRPRINCQNRLVFLIVLALTKQPKVKGGLSSEIKRNPIRMSNIPQLIFWVLKYKI